MRWEDNIIEQRGIYLLKTGLGIRRLLLSNLWCPSNPVRLLDGLKCFLMLYMSSVYIRLSISILMLLLSTQLLISADLKIFLSNENDTLGLINSDIYAIPWLQIKYRKNKSCHQTA